MSNTSDALIALNISDYTLEGEPTNKQEFLESFKKVTGVDEEGNGVHSSDPTDFGVTWDEVQAKIEELISELPMKRLRKKRNTLLAETDWWASSDLVITQEQLAYRQALRDITETCTSLEDAIFPIKPQGV